MVGIPARPQTLTDAGLVDQGDVSFTEPMVTGSALPPQPPHAPPSLT